MTIPEKINPPKSDPIKVPLRISRKKVMRVVLLNPYFSSITKVSYIEKGRETKNLKVIKEATNIKPVINGLNSKLLAKRSTWLKPPRRIKGRVMRKDTVLLIKSK